MTICKSYPPLWLGKGTIERVSRNGGSNDRGMYTLLVIELEPLLHWVYFSYCNPDAIHRVSQQSFCRLGECAACQISGTNHMYITSYHATTSHLVSFFLFRSEPLAGPRL
jgi:hypothetical protein